MSNVVSVFTAKGKGKTGLTTFHGFCGVIN